ncbi:MAG TPA: PEP-CTERM system histidine kinase PrsK, partial [Novosphingobium sp.]|nr:PEP-CTERM system histidine kinase PrsK [Novosphingobium sp.]
MSPLWQPFWHGTGLVVHLLGALAALAAAGWIGSRKHHYGEAGLAVVVALVLSALWCFALMALGPLEGATRLAEGLRNLGWLFATYRLFASDGRHVSVAPIRPVVLVLALVEAIHLLFEGLAWFRTGMTAEIGGLMTFAVMLSLLGSVGGLLLVHNLYLGASPQSRLVLRWPAAAMAALMVFDLNFYTVAWLSAEWPTALGALRGLALAAAAGLLAIGALRRREDLRLSPSRAMTFQTVSLILIGSYFLVMFGLA